MSDTVEMLENDTRNQHFVDQGEQRLNAMNPQADPDNQRIYSFEVVDRDNYTSSSKTRSAGQSVSNLSLFDLFQLRRAGRQPPAAQFRVSVPQIRSATSKIIRRACSPNSTPAAVTSRPRSSNLFAAKLLNFVRNPFSIVKGSQ